MPEYVRVRDKATRHEYTVVASVVRDDLHEVLDEPALAPTGLPREPKHHTAEKATRVPVEQSGRKAHPTEKENTDG